VCAPVLATMSFSMVTLESALVDAERVEAAAVADRVLSKALDAYCRVSGCGGASQPVGAAPHVAGSLAMFAVLCKHFVPGVMPQDFAEVELFSGMAADPAFAPVAELVIDRVALELVLLVGGRPVAEDSYMAELVPALTLREGSTTNAAFAAHAADTGAPFLDDVETVGEFARLFKLVATVTGLPTDSISPFLFTAITLGDMWKVYKATNSLRRTWTSLLSDSTKILNIFLTIAQVAVTTTLASNESDPMTFLFRPVQQALNGVFPISRDWGYLHPSASRILEALNTGESDTYVPFYGYVNENTNGIIAYLRRTMAGHSDGNDFASLATRYSVMKGGKALSKWIDVVRDTRGSGWWSDRYYQEMENLGVLLAATAQFLNGSALFRAFKLINVDFFQVDPRNGLLRVKGKLDEIGRSMPVNDAGMAQVDRDDQDRIDDYAQQMVFAAANDISSRRLLPLMRNLLYVRSASELAGWSVQESTLQTLLVDTMRAFDRLADESGYMAVGAACADPRASVVDALFRARLS
jgi:hypothetical protein